MRMKLFARVFLLALVVALLSPVFAFAYTEVGMVKTPSSDGAVNVRSGPGTQYEVVGWGQYGDALDVLSEGRDWYKVRVERTGKIGYIRSVYIEKVVDVSTLGNWGSIAYVMSKYNASEETIRTNAGTRYAVTGALNPNDPDGIVAHVGGWYQVQMVPSLRTGYVHNTYLAAGLDGLTTGNVYLRQAGANSAKAIDVVSLDADIKVLGAGKNWSKIKYGHLTGFIYNKYFEFAG